MPEVRSDVKFLCDEMLGRLARYLRAAGYDTALAQGGMQDAALLQMAHAERRHFLTRDQRVAEHLAARDVAFLLTSGDLTAMATALRTGLGVNWLHRPFTRCLVDNTLLTPVATTDHARLPPDVRAVDALCCPVCERVYWEGSHHRRILARLRDWSA